MMTRKSIMKIKSVALLTKSILLIVIIKPENMNELSILRKELRKRHNSLNILKHWKPPRKSIKNSQNGEMNLHVFLHACLPYQIL